MSRDCSDSRYQYAYSSLQEVVESRDAVGNFHPAYAAAQVEKFVGFIERSNLPPEHPTVHKWLEAITAWNRYTQKH